MRQKQNGESVHGPYPHRKRWRVILRKAGGSQEAFSFETEAEARRHKAKLEKEIQGRTVSDAAQAHIVSMRDRGLRRSTVLRAEMHLRNFFQLDDEHEDKTIAFAKTGGLLDDLRPNACQQLYDALTKKSAVDTHRNALAAAKMFGQWCVEQGWLATSPVERVKPIGQRNRGKKQLRIDEARKLVDLCIKKANAGEDAAVGVLTSLLLGLRVSEVTDRVVRDLDDDGRLLWIEFGKTKRSRRTLEVPALLRPYLLALAKDRGPEEQLITRAKTKRGNKRNRQWLRHWLEAFCGEAQVPQVCMHSLRGLHATLATEAGQTSHAVASALGHSSPAVTNAHYIERGAKRRASTKRVVAAIAQPTGNLHLVGNG